MPTSLDRRAFMAYCSSLGLGTTLLPGVLWARIAAGADITKETVACAEEIAGVKFTDEQRTMMVENLRRQQRAIEALHKILPGNDVSPVLHFDPLPPGVTLDVPAKRPMVRSRVPVMAAPSNLEELAFLPVTTLSELVRTRKVTSQQLTRMYLGRLKKHDPTLHAVITLTDERALRQARAADEDIARGRYRGALH
ncbi:MAG: amidase, partial [Gemmatimonadaceae bacterium]